eukprot:TRINITY_DN26143_c0_g1_i1.p1 TRINITY_DN26143_c0_g1~~TRINITY_DN26143_c0_g1_i1.p1  ORF type:complete len:182 (-),score=44.22 TRINITY_DN26143_c0_g1_i1:52-597(-)
MSGGDGNAVLAELISTEDLYVNALTLGLDHFQKNLLSRNLITQDESQVLFSNLSSILAEAKSFLADLKGISGEPTEGLAGVLQKHMNEFTSLYTTYVGNYGKATALLKNKSSDANFQSAAAAQSENGLSLSAILAIPTNRLKKYAGLFKQLRNITGKDSGVIQNATKQIAGLVSSTTAAQK